MAQALGIAIREIGVVASEEFVGAVSRERHGHVLRHILDRNQTGSAPASALGSSE